MKIYFIIQAIILILNVLNHIEQIIKYCYESRIDKFVLYLKEV